MKKWNQQRVQDSHSKDYFDFEMGVRISDVKIQEFDRILPACVLAESI